jgi:hypothetical protein
MKPILFVQILLLLFISCSTNAFNKRKPIVLASNYSQKSSKKINEQYTYNPNEIKIEDSCSKKKKVNVVTDSIEKVKITKTVSTKAIKNKIKPIRKTVLKRTSIPTTILNENSNIKDNSNKQKSQSIEYSYNRGHSYGKIGLILLLSAIVLFFLGWVIYSLLIMFWPGIILIALSPLTLVASFVFLLLWIWDF